MRKTNDPTTAIVSLLLAAAVVLWSVIPHRLAVAEIAFLGSYGLSTVGYLAAIRGSVAENGPELPVDGY